VNGLLGTYPLFLMSTRQWRELLGERRGGRLLDVGAAAGDVTSALAPLFDHVVAIDTSATMVRRLRARGLDAHHVDLTTNDLVGRHYDTVTALNVLDRCADPLTLLARMIDVTRPGGTLVVSVPLPYDPWVYRGPTLRRPRAPLPLAGRSWHEDLVALLDVLERHGVGIERIARTPYLSGGDRHRSHYELDAAVIVARVGR
jgi:SAM-dependent methyltransferase